MKHIVVAGASKGIGYALVKELVRGRSVSVLAMARSGEKLEQLVGECREFSPGSRVIPLTVDVGAEGAVDKILQVLKGDFPRVDHLVYNAGLLVNKPVEKLEDEDFDRMFGVNVKGAFSLIRAMLPFFTEKAHILTISSMGGYQGSVKFPGLSLYSASKGALAVLTECLAEELRGRNIKCNCLALGAVQTEMLAEAFPGYTAPLSPAEMAGFIADFSLNGHRYFNGKILPVSLSIP